MNDPASPQDGPHLNDRDGLGQVRDTVALGDSGAPVALATVTTLLGESSPSLTPAALDALRLRYDILGEAGHGSMGNVYRARDRETGETVALKLLKPEIASDQAMMDRFKRELLFARKITHKHVCRVYEFNRIGGIAYTSMEFVEGESLRSVLNRFGGLSLRKGIDLALQICSGLKEAHAQGIVHRDLKPENVMIDVRGNVKIMDFGIARSMEALTRLTGAMIGTPAYMAPEQVEGKAADFRTDIYALGLILYELFTGAQAFCADNAVAVALKQMREMPPLPRHLDPAIPNSLERAILKCLEKDPAKRFQSMADLEAALRSSSVARPASVTRVDTIATPAAALPNASLPSRPMPRAKRQSHRVAVICLVLVAGLAASAAVEGRHWRSVWRAAQAVPAPPSMPVPVPPAAALVYWPAPPQAEPSAPSPASPASAKPVAPAPRAVRSASVPPVSVPARGNAPDGAGSAAPFRRPRPQAPAAFRGPDLSSADRTQYLFVGRFRVEDRAWDVVKKIEGLHLPAGIVPRHTPAGDFFFVVSGPFAPAKSPGVMQQLRAAGFHDVRPVNTQLDRQNANP